MQSFCAQNSKCLLNCTPDVRPVGLVLDGRGRRLDRRREARRQGGGAGGGGGRRRAQVRGAEAQGKAAGMY